MHLRDETVGRRAEYTPRRTEERVKPKGFLRKVRAARPTGLSFTEDGRPELVVPRGPGGPTGQSRLRQ